MLLHFPLSLKTLSPFSVNVFERDLSICTSVSVKMSNRSSRTLYVGNLPGDIREREVDDLFYKYGRIAHIDLKIPPKPPGYAFVEFEESRDAESAIRGRDGYDFDGHRLRVELAHGGRGQSSKSDRYSSFAGRGRGGASRHSDYRVSITGLPSSASWQDLKDHMRKAGDVCFSQVFRDGDGTTGIVDYTNSDDMKYAIKKLDGSEFRNAFSRKHVRVKQYTKTSSRSTSRSPSNSRGRSRSRSRGHDRDLSSSRSRSWSRSRSRSGSPKAKSSKRSAAKSRSRSVSPHTKSRSKSRSLSRYGFMRQYGDCMLGSGLDMVQILAAPLVVESGFLKWPALGTWNTDDHGLP